MISSKQNCNKKIKTRQELSSAKRTQDGGQVKASNFLLSLETTIYNVNWDAFVLNLLIHHIFDKL